MQHGRGEDDADASLFGGMLRPDVSLQRGVIQHVEHVVFLHGSMFEHDHRLQGRVARALSQGIRDSAVIQDITHVVTQEIMKQTWK